MVASERFRGPAADLDLVRLLNRGLYVLGLCFAVAVGVHVGLMLQSLEQVGETAERPLTTRFVQRRPRLTKPMELRKQPRPRPRQMVRQQVQVQARASRLTGSRWGGISLRSLSAPEVALEGGGQLVAIDLGAHGVGIGVTTSKEPENKIDMREQLLDLNYLDTGKYQAMVIQDPENKRNIQGYFHIAQAYSARMVERNVLTNIIGGDSGTEMLQNPHAVQNLVSALNEFTGIEADFSARLPLSSKELMETPWLFVPGLAFTLTEGELENLGRYLEAGGFILADAGGGVGGDVDIYLRQMIRDGLAKAGRRASFFRLPPDHPIYHAFFDFESPPSAIVGQGGGIGTGRGNVDYMVGLEIDGRLAVVLSYQSLGAGWENVGFRNEKSLYTDNSRLLQFGINTIVFALTQEGSITNRVMQTVR